MPVETMDINLQDLQSIMNMLPVQPEGEKRKHALTPDDILIIAKIVQAMSHKTCAMGFSSEEIGRVKTILNITNKSILGIGWLIIATITGAMLKAAWWGISHGVLETAETVRKGAGK